MNLFFSFILASLLLSFVVVSCFIIFLWFYTLYNSCFDWTFFLDLRSSFVYFFSFSFTSLHRFSWPKSVHDLNVHVFVWRGQPSLLVFSSATLESNRIDETNTEDDDATAKDWPQIANHYMKNITKELSIAVDMEEKKSENEKRQTVGEQWNRIETTANDFFFPFFFFLNTFNVFCLHFATFVRRMNNSIFFN